MGRRLLLSFFCGLVARGDAQSERSIVIMNQSGRRIEVHWVRKCTAGYLVLFV